MTTQYEVTAVSARINNGVLKLTKEQAAPRLHNLQALKGGNYEVLRPVEFKRGEVIGYEGELPKALASVVEKAESKSKAKADAKADADSAQSGGDGAQE